jgi:hypothetical protein
MLPVGMVPQFVQVTKSHRRGDISMALEVGDFQPRIKCAGDGAHVPPWEEGGWQARPVVAKNTLIVGIFCWESKE